MNDNERFDNAFMLRVITETVNAGQNVRFSGTGTSMMPTINPETDTVILSPITRPLKTGDICLYTRENDKAVTHRIYRIKNNRYDMMGDNQFWLERGVPRERIIAVAVKIIRNGEEISLDKSLQKKTAHLRAVKRRIVISFKSLLRFLYKKYKKYSDK